MQGLSVLSGREAAACSCLGHKSSRAAWVRSPTSTQRAHRVRGDVRCQGAAWLAGQALGVGAAAAAAWLLSRQPAEEHQDQMETTSRRPCPSCGGTGYEECMCTKWSDGDVGCNSCSHTGYMKCRSCGGKGTAVPIKVSIRRNDAL